MPEKPLRHSPEVKAAAAEKLADRIRQWLGADDAESCVAHVAKIIHNDNGYQLAKQMEGLGYDPDAELVGILDDASFVLSEAYDEARVRWLAESGITAKFSPGAVGRVSRGFYAGKFGPVVSIDERRGKYTVRLPVEMPASGYIGSVIDWEDLEPVDG